MFKTNKFFIINLEHRGFDNHFSYFMKRPLFSIAVGLGVALLVSFSTTMTAHAVTTYSIESIGNDIGLGNADLKQSVINILNLALGLLSLIAVVMVIIGGFTWLTSAGNEEKVDQAKKTISAAIVGIVIVLLAWAIVSFVANTTANVTTAP